MAQISSLAALHLLDFAAHLYHPGEDLHPQTSDPRGTPILTDQGLSRARDRQDDTELGQDLTPGPDPRPDDEVVDVAIVQAGTVAVGEDAAGVIAVIVVMMTGVEADLESEGAGEDVNQSCRVICRKCNNI